MGQNWGSTRMLLTACDPTENGPTWEHGFDEQFNSGTHEILDISLETTYMIIYVIYHISMIWSYM